MPNDDQGRGANVPLSPFSGSRNEDFSQYLKQFELICDANNYKADKRAQILASYLRDKAFYVYDSLPATTKDDYDALKKALQDKFQTTDQSRYLHQKFQERKQGYSENVMEYGCDLHRLGMAALAKVDPEQRDHLIREKFLAGLRPEYHKLIVYSNPKNFHDAMTLAERLEGLQSGERDQAVKHTLLLEGIQQKLERLEISRNHPDHSSTLPLATYAVHRGEGMPVRSFRPNGAYLNNFRQTLGPRGNRCYRCNRSGHIARNCPQGFNPRSVICRTCNRPGHFARDCQRRLPPSRQPNYSRPPPIRRYLPGNTIGASTLRFAAPPFPNSVMPQQNQAMVTVQPEETTDDKPRWQPLVASVLGSPVVIRSESRGTAALEAPEVNRQSFIQNPTNITDGYYAELPEGVELTKTLAPEKFKWDWFFTYLRQLVKVGSAKATQMVIVVLIILACHQHLTVEAYGETSDEDVHSIGPNPMASPMICQAHESRILWKLPQSFACPNGNHTAQDDVKPTAMKLFKRNFIQYKSQAWKCIKITQEMETYTYFFGDENLKRENKYQESVSAEQCVAMKQFKRCHNEPMVYQGGIYQTNNKLNWYYPGGGINCCHWKKFKVTNCYLYRTSVYKKHNNPKMESGAGDVSECVYTKGQCILEDGSFLLWKVNNRSFCDLLPWKTVPGKMFGTSWLSDDSNLALTFTSGKTTTDCHKLPLRMSDQGIAVRVLPTSSPREKRSIQYGGFVSSAQLAASLEALELKWKESLTFAFSHALNGVCNFMKSVVELLKAQILANPTMAVRALINQSNIFVKAGGDMLEIFPCNALDHTLQAPVKYAFLPMNGSCSEQIPIKFSIHGRQHTGYMDPVTNIIHRYSVPMDCRLVKQIPVKLNGWDYLYQSGTGFLRRVKNVPPLKVLHWNTEAMIDAKATIYHEIVIYSWDELQSHISLNDVLGSLNKQRAVLRHLGITEDDQDPKQTAGKAVSSIMSKGYFGFLHGLAANAYQIWTFCVCLYVTLGVLIIHCLPINAMPAGLNFTNAFNRIKNIWTRWRYRQRQYYEATGENLPRRLMHVHLSPRRLSRRKNNKYTTSLTPIPQSEVLPPVPSHYPSVPNAPAVVGTIPADNPRPSKWRVDTSSELQRSDPQPFRINATSSETTVGALIDGLRVHALIDSGSNLTIIPYRIAKQLRNTIVKGPVTAISMTGHQLPIMGEIEAIIRIGQKDMCGKVVVASQAPYDLIIGTDLMKQLQEIRFDFKNQKIQIGQEILPMTNCPAPARVFLCQGVRLPARTQTVVMGLCFGIEPSKENEASYCYFAPSHKLISKYQVIGQDALVQPTEKLIPITLTNPDNSPKYLPQKASLGCVSSIRNGEMEIMRWSPAWMEKPKSGTRTSEELQDLTNKLNVGDELSSEMREELNQLITKYEILFAKSDVDLGKTHLIEHHIDTGNARPIRQAPYRTPHSLRPYINKKIEEMLEAGVIQPSQSAWASPVVLAKKKGTDELRFCIDNTKLNDVTVKDSYPFKRIEDAFDMLAGSRYYATLDLQTGYWQIPLRKEDQEKTAFVTFAGLYECRRMNFGLCNGPATCQRLMDQVLRGLDLNICMSYIDDIIIPASSFNELLKRVELVFQRLVAANLKLKARKCHFGKTELEFLGFIVSKQGLKPNPEKTNKISEAKAPTNQDELRRFLGLTGWCKRFIEGYAHIVEPLTRLLRKSPKFEWTEEAEAAFSNLKHRYSSPPILAYPDMEKPFIVCTDASNTGIGAVLIQEDEERRERPISYDSRVLSKSEKNYSTIEKEMLAIYWAITKKYKAYVYGHDFKVFTDHKPLIGLWKAPPDDGRLGKWCVLLQGYRNRMSIEHRPGKQNVVADFLSRIPPKQVLATTNQIPEEQEGLRSEEQYQDPYLGPIIRHLKEEDTTDPADESTRKKAQDFILYDGVLYYRNKNKPLLALPDSRKEEILVAVHDSLLGGHLGVRKTLSKVEQKYYWPTCHKDVVEWCRTCQVCQARKNPYRNIKAPLRPIEVRTVNQRWGWDICGPYPLSRQGNKYILVCMEYFAKFPEAFAIPDTKTERLAKIFVENIVLRYGCPDVLLSDQGANVNSDLVKEICKMLDIEKLRTSPYHPQTDGMTERFNRTMNDMISMYVNAGHDDWCEFLPYILFAYRTSKHETTQETPFFLMYGFEARLAVDVGMLPSNPLYLADADDYKTYVLTQLLKSREAVQSRITAAQAKQKKQYDQKCCEGSFLVGDSVLLFIPSSKKGHSRKFLHKWKGPYRILKLSNDGRNAFVKAIAAKRSKPGEWAHVNRLKKFHGDPGTILRPTAVNPTPPEMEASSQEQEHEECAKCKRRGKPGQWIGCDGCEKWYHFQCVELREPPEAETWICPRCHEGSAIREDGNPDQEEGSVSEGSEDSVVTVPGNDLDTANEAPAETVPRYFCFGLAAMSHELPHKDKPSNKWSGAPLSVQPQRSISRYKRARISTDTITVSSSPTPASGANHQMENSKQQGSGNWVMSDWKPEAADFRIPEDKQLPETVRVGQRLGKGGFGSVYEGTRVEDGATVAIKRIPNNKIFSWTKLQDNSVPTEIEFLRKCAEIPGVIKVLDWGQSGDSFYFTMLRKPDEVDLHEYLRKTGPLQEYEARNIFKQLVDITSACLRIGLVHCDIKEENILFNPSEGTVTVIDFGAAAYIEDSPFEDTRGTRLYLPPEWFRKRQYFGEQALSWSLGVVLFSLVGHDIPFRTSMEILENNPSYNPRHSEELRDLIAGCLSTSAVERLKMKQIASHPWMCTCHGIAGTLRTEASQMPPTEKQIRRHPEAKLAINPGLQPTKPQPPTCEMLLQQGSRKRIPNVFANTTCTAAKATNDEETQQTTANDIPEKGLPLDNLAAMVGGITTPTTNVPDTDRGGRQPASQKNRIKLYIRRLPRCTPSGRSIKPPTNPDRTIKLNGLPPRCVEQGITNDPIDGAKPNQLTVGVPVGVPRSTQILFKLYEIGTKIGEGARSKVYSGVRLTDGLPVAIKKLNKMAITDWSAAQNQMIPREVATLLQCQKIEGVATLYDHGLVGADYYIVLGRPSFDGTLQDYLLCYVPVDPEFLVATFKQITAIRQSCLKNGVCHQNPHPDNVLINITTGSVTLVGFGAAVFIKPIFP